RLDPEQLVRLGNVAYAVGLAQLMLRREGEAREWLQRAAARWRESWEHATPTSWGRPIGVLKAKLIAGDDEGAADAARWALELGVMETTMSITLHAAAFLRRRGGRVYIWQEPFGRGWAWDKLSIEAPRDVEVSFARYPTDSGVDVYVADDVDLPQRIDIALTL